MQDVQYLASGSFELIKHTESLREYAPHSHGASYTLGLVLSGAICLHSDKKQILRSGDSFALPPLRWHCIHTVECYSMLTISIREPLPANAIFTDFVSYMVPAHATAFTALFSTLPAKPLIKTAMAEAVAALYYGNEHKPHGSTYHYIREFKKATGLPPAKFRIQSMVRQAQRLLLTAKSLATIAQECGFYDQSHMHKTFKRFTGLTPAEFRRVSTKPNAY